MKIPEITRYDPQPPYGVCGHCSLSEEQHEGGHGLALVCAHPTKEQARTAFQEIMDAGTQRFDSAFLAETIDVVRLARTYGLDVEEPGIRAVLATLTYEICAVREGVWTS